MHFSRVVLPEPLWPINPERRALLYLERDVAERPEVLGPHAPREHALLQGARPFAEQAEDLGDVFDLERDGHSSSAKSPERRKKSRHV